MTALLAATVVAVAAWAAQPAAAPRRRLTSLVAVPGPEGAHRSPKSGGSTGLSPSLRRATALGSLLTVAAVLPLPWGLSLGAVVAVLLNRWLSAQPGRRELAEAASLRRQLPLALELVAAALSCGATGAAAVELAAGATDPPLSRVLGQVSAGLRLGAPAEQAWLPALETPELVVVAKLAVRSSTSGAAMAVACRDLATRSRLAQAAQAQAVIKRAGVHSVLPLALCFLPAFVLVGVVPLVAGLLRSLSL